jgi:flagellar basal body-associated protein FliL
MRFQCTFCLSLIETDQGFGTQLVCPSCKRKCFTPRSRFSHSRIIGDFVIRERIGSGSGGKVFKAVQLSLGRTVALKILTADENSDPKKYEDFMHEARAAARLNHVNLIQAYAVGEEDGIYYMAMNLVDGETLKARLLREGSIEIDEALHIVQQVAEALWYAWENAHMVHRDVKPENIMITSDGIVKLTDMGLAVIQSEFSENSDIAGSPSYMSPEQLSGGSPDTRSDIYSLGVTLYEMLSGELPFKAHDFETVATQHFTEEAIPLRRLNRAIPLRVSNLARQMMEKMPEDRFADMNGLLDEIWKIRQTTAPDSSMIPDVHTISINRLNYDLQRLPAKPEAEAGEQKPGKKQRDSFVPFIIISIILFLLMVASYGYQYYLSRAEQDKTALLLPLRERVELFEKNVRNNNAQNVMLLEKEGQDILENMPGRRDESMSVLYWKVRYYLTELKSRSTDGRLKSREDEIRDLKSRLDSEQQWNAALNDEILQLKKSNELMQTKMKADETLFKEQSAKLKTELDNALKSNRSFNISREQFWKDQFLVSLYSIIRGRDYPRGSALIDYQLAQQDKAYAPWLEAFREPLASLEALDVLFFSKTSKLTGIRIPNEGQVVMVDGGMIFYQSGNAVRSRPWYEFSADTLYALIRQINQKLADNRLRFEALLAVYGGNMGHPALNQAAAPLKELRRVVLDVAIENIRITAYNNRTQAAAEAGSLLERFRHDPELEKSISASLKDLLGQ